MTTASRAAIVVMALTWLHVMFAGERPLALRANPAAQSAIDPVLARAAAYADRYLEVMSNLTVDEHYVQNLAGVRPMVSTFAGAAQSTQRRELRSDIVLIRIGPPFEWRVYRDVFEVDGRPVRDRTDRLERLLLEPAESARAQAERIAEEGARFNIGSFGRVLNEPGIPLLLLQTELQPRFAFTLVERDGTHVLEYEERVRPTLFWHNRTIENPSSGRVWIDMATGDVTRTEHTLAPSDFRATFTTSFRHDDRHGVSLPTEMREELWASVQANARKVTGVARYSNYRRFAVAVN
jgi:hypothetical protein